MELVLIRGLPGSGKTTMALALASDGYHHHEADHYFERDGAYHFDATKLREAHAQCLLRTKASLFLGASCVVANTFTQAWEMRPYIDAARDAGAELRIIEARGSWKSIHGVPCDVIERMRARWEALP